MLQRNDSGYPKLFPTLVPPVEVEVGGTINFPTLLPGFTEVDAQAPPVVAEPEPMFAPAVPEPAPVAVEPPPPPVAPLLAPPTGFGIGMTQTA